MIKNRYLFITLNLSIIIDFIIILFFVLIKTPSAFHYFTVLSNLFMVIVASLAIFLAIKSTSSQFLNNLYLIATTSLVLVFLVVAFFLAPQFENYFYLFSEYNFFLHFLNPLFAVISLLLLKNPEYNFKTCFYTLIPPALYAIIYFIFVILKKDWPDFYNFTLGGKDWLSFFTLLIILGVTYLISATLVLLSKKLSKNPEKESSFKDKNVLN